MNMNQMIMTNANNQKFSRAPPARKLYCSNINIDVSEGLKNVVRI